MQRVSPPLERDSVQLLSAFETERTHRRVSCDSFSDKGGIRGEEVSSNIFSDGVGGSWGSKERHFLLWVRGPGGGGE